MRILFRKVYAIIAEGMLNYRLRCIQMSAVLVLYMDSNKNQTNPAGKRVVEKEIIKELVGKQVDNAVE